MADRISLNVKKSRLHKTLEDPKIVERIIRDASTEAVKQGQDVAQKKVQELTPLVSGKTRLSWQKGPIRLIKRFTVRGNVFSRSAGANVLERGAKPHFPAFLPSGTNPGLGSWIEKKLGITDPRRIRQVGFLIGRKFKQVGIRARQITTKANIAILPDLKKISKKLGISISSRLAGRKSI